MAETIESAMNSQSGMPQVSAPGVGEVVLWLTPSDEASVDGLLAGAESLLSATERDRFSGFKAADAARMFLLGRVLMRRVLGGNLGLAPEDVPIVIDDGGKPRVAAPAAQGLVFSLSHDRGRAVLAVGREAGLGIDLVDLDRAYRVHHVAERWFPEGERQAMASGNRPVDRAVALWAGKEALAKARGHSLFYELRRDLGESLASPEDGSDGADAGEWHLLHTETDDGIALALAYRGAGAPQVSCRLFRGDGIDGGAIRVGWAPLV